MTDEGVETKPFCAHCAGLTAKLETATKQHDELLKKLGIPHPAAPAAPVKAAPAK